MKSIVSISVDEDLIDEIEQYLETQNFRNKSHFFETAIRQYMSSSIQPSNQQRSSIILNESEEQQNPKEAKRK